MSHSLVSFGGLCDARPGFLLLWTGRLVCLFLELQSLVQFVSFSHLFFPTSSQMYISAQYCESFFQWHRGVFQTAQRLRVDWKRRREPSRGSMQKCICKMMRDILVWMGRLQPGEGLRCVGGGSSIVAANMLGGCICVPGMSVEELVWEKWRVGRELKQVWGVNRKWQFPRRLMRMKVLDEFGVRGNKQQREKHCGVVGV